MKKTLILFSVALLFITCKKDVKTTPNIELLDITGTWNLYSWNGSGINVNADEYPCMTENIIVFNADQSVTGNYTGMDTCYVTHDLTNNTRLRGAAIGVPGQQPYSNTWLRTGNDIYYGGNHAVITKVEDKLILTISDTVINSGTKYITTVVDIKK